MPQLSLCKIVMAKPFTAPEFDGIIEYAEAQGFPQSPGPVAHKGPLHNSQIRPCAEGPEEKNGQRL